MKRYIGTRAFFGFCCGVTIGVAITLLISGVQGAEELLFIPQFVRYFGSAWRAALVTVLWTGLIGVTFAEAALIFETARWSLAVQYLVHFLITGAVYLPFLLLCNLPLHGWRVLLIPGNILLTYGITWGIQHAQSKRAIREINAALEKNRHGRD